MVENVTQIKSQITINVDVSVKIKTLCVCDVKKIIFGSLLNVVV